MIVDEEVDGLKGDYLRWIDTSANAVRFLNEDDDILTIERNIEYKYLRCATPEESLAIKAKSRKWRASKQEQERLEDLDDCCDSHREYSLSTSSEFIRPRHVVFCSGDFF